MLLFILVSKPGMLLWLFSSTPNTRQVLPKIQSIIEILSLNLSGLYNKINLCNIRDSSAAKNSMKRQIVWEKGKWIIPRRVNKMQPSQSNWNFPDFSPVPLSKPELFKLTIKMKMEKYYLTRRQICQFLPWLKKKVRSCNAYRGSIVTFFAWRYNSRETAWFQTTELKNAWKS